MSKLYAGRNAPLAPVVDALCSAGLGPAQQAGQLGGPAIQVNEFCISHAHIKHHVCTKRNSMFKRFVEKS